MRDGSSTMVAAEQATSPAFTRMPAELLNMVLEHVVTDSGYWRIVLDFPNLKNLRLACRQYAYLPSLLAMLFSSVRLVASPEHCRVVAKTDLIILRQHIRNVAFEPSKESWVTPREVFDDIILVHPFEAAMENLIEQFHAQGGEDWFAAFQAKKEEEVEKMKRLGVRQFIDKYLPADQRIFSEEELSEGYVAYLARANATKALFDSGELAMTWAKALGQLSRVEGVSVKHWRFDRLRGDHHGTKGWRERGVSVYGHNHPGHHGYAHEERHCREVQAPVGELLFSTVLLVLAGARTKVKMWDIENCGTGEFAWADDGSLEDVDLSTLQKLAFRPRITEITEFLSPASTAHLERRCGRALVALLSRSSSSLTDFELLSDVAFCPSVWPPKNVDVAELPEMSALKRFVTAATINLDTFPGWLGKCMGIQRLELQCCGGVGRGRWRQLWDAIRYHPRRMDLYFDQIPCNDAAEISLVHYTGEESTEKEEEDAWGDISRSLGNYLSNKGPWNKSCRMWFEDEDDDEDDDEDGEEGREEGGHGDDDGDADGDEEMGSHDDSDDN